MPVLLRLFLGAHTAAFQGLTVLAGLMVSIGGSSLVAQCASA